MLTVGPSLARRLLWTGGGMVICFTALLGLAATDTDCHQQLLLAAVLAINTVYSSVNAVFQVIFWRWHQVTVWVSGELPGQPWSVSGAVHRECE